MNLGETDLPKTITDTFPPMPLRDIVRIVNDFPRMSIDEKKDAIALAVKVHPTINLDWGEGWVYHRCRIVDSEDKPGNLRGLIWRSDTTAALGRANPAGFRVMYLADRPETALRECRVKRSPVVLTDFVIRKSCGVRVAPIGELQQVQRTGRGFLLGNHSDTVANYLNACGKDHARSLLITDAFLHQCFVGQDDHEISSHVAISIFHKNPVIKAIAYQSVRQSGGVNFAVRVEDFWDTWGVRSVIYGEAVHLALGYYDIDAQKCVVEIDDEGALSWADLCRPNRLFTFEPPHVPALQNTN